MKCPKCGSELDTVFNCTNCGYKRYEVAVSKTELTTAEMLLWLVGKSNEGVFSIIQARDVIMLNFVIGKNHINAREETLNEAIKQAYGWAKQEEQK